MWKKKDQNEGKKERRKNSGRSGSIRRMWQIDEQKQLSTKDKNCSFFSIYCPQNYLVER